MLSAYREPIVSDVLGALEENEQTIESLRVKIGITWRTARKYLQALEDAGVISVKKVGNIRVYRLHQR